MMPNVPPALTVAQEVPGYAAIVTSDTIVVTAGTIIRKMTRSSNSKLFQELHAAIRAEAPLIDIEDIFQRR